MSKLCKFGCGQEGIKQYSDGSWCCSNHANQCPSRRKFFKENPSLPFATKLENSTEMCFYNCGQIAKFQFLNKKYCCSDHYMKCPENKKITIKTMTGSKRTEESKLKIKEARKRQIITSEHARKSAESNTLHLKDYEEKYPLLLKEEEIIENEKGEFFGHCKYSGCENSKENGGWFQLTKGQICDRKYAVYNGGYGSYFYCSDECKGKCDLFNPKGDPLSIPSDFPYTYQEYQTFRNEVLRRQKDEHGFNFCERCHSTEDLQVHHSIAIKLVPGYSLDPDNGIILCKEKCHKIEHQAGKICGLGKLANLICK